MKRAVCAECGWQGVAVACERCGRIADGVETECEIHPDRRAAFLCVVCGMPLCASCAVPSGTAHLCGDPAHSTVLNDWVSFRSVPSSVAADLIVRNLTLNRIAAQAFDRSISGVDRSTAVWIKREDLASAETLLATLDIDALEERDGSPAGSPKRRRTSNSRRAVRPSRKRTAS
jgi:hypothetical protein